MTLEGTFFRPYANELWWRFVRPLLTDDKWRLQVCNGLMDLGFAKLVYYYWRFVVHRFCFAVMRDLHSGVMQVRIGSIEDAVCCLEQMLAPYSSRACALKQMLLTLAESRNNCSLTMDIV